MSVAVQTADPETSELWLTFKEFIRLKERGVYGDPKSKLELIDGRVYRLEPVSIDHFEGSNNLAFALREAVRAAGLGDDVLGGGNGILQLSETRSVVPDGMVFRRTPTQFAQASACLLAAEYAVSSHHRDLRIKPALYASAGVPEYWVVERRTHRLHVFREPRDGAYAHVLEPLSAGASIAPLFAPDIAIPVTDLL